MLPPLLCGAEVLITVWPFSRMEGTAVMEMEAASIIGTQRVRRDEGAVEQLQGAGEVERDLAAKAVACGQGSDLRRKAVDLVHSDTATVNPHRAAVTRECGGDSDRASPQS